MQYIIGIVHINISVWDIINRNDLHTTANLTLKWYQSIVIVNLQNIKIAFVHICYDNTYFVYVSPIYN